MKQKKRFNEVASNFLNLSLINILNLIVTLITIPYLSRALGPDNYGYYFIFTSASLFATIVTDYSTQITGVRHVALNADKALLQQIYAQYQAIRVVLGVGSCLVFTLYTLYTVPHISIITVLSYYLFILAGHYLTAAWFHQGISQLTCLAIATLVSRALQILALLLLVRQPTDMLFAVFINAFAYLVTGIAAWWYRMARLGIKESPQFKGLSAQLKEGWDSFVGDFAPNLYSNIPLLIIGSLVSPAVFASYSIAMRLTAIAGAVQLMLSKAAYPLITKGQQTFGTLLRLNLLLSLIPALIIILYSAPLISFFLGEGYTDVAPYLTYLAPGIVFNGILVAYTYGYFLPNRYDREFRNISIFVSITSAVMGYGLIYYFNVIGAIAMFVFARMLFALCYALVHRQLNRL